MNDDKNWLEEVWEIKEKIAEETKKMSFSDYLKYLRRLAQKAERRISATATKVSEK